MKKIPIELARTSPPMQNDQDWRPNPNEKETGSFFWGIFTGHPKVFGQKDIKMFIDINDGKIILPPSELSFDLDTSYQGLLHLSWLGICHNNIYFR